MEELPLPKLYQLQRHDDVQALMAHFMPPLVACIVCTANHSLAALRNPFILEVAKAWMDPAQNKAKTIHTTDMASSPSMEA